LPLASRRTQGRAVHRLQFGWPMIGNKFCWQSLKHRNLESCFLFKVFPPSDCSPKTKMRIPANPMIPQDHPRGGRAAGSRLPSLRSGSAGADECVRPHTNKARILRQGRRRVDVTLVTSQVSKLLDRGRGSEEYAVNFFQRNRGSEYAVEFLAFGCPLTAHRKQS